MGLEKKPSAYRKKFGFEPVNDMAGRWLANALFKARGGKKRKSRRRESRVHVAAGET